MTQLCVVSYCEVISGFRRRGMGMLAQLSSVFDEASLNRTLAIKEITMTPRSRCKRSRVETMAIPVANIEDGKHDDDTLNMTPTRYVTNRYLSDKTMGIDQIRAIFTLIAKVSGSDTVSSAWQKPLWANHE